MQKLACLILASVFGCAAPVNERRISHADLAQPETRTRITGFYVTSVSHLDERRELPQGVQSSAVIDEAAILSWNAASACLRVTLRSMLSDDVPLSSAEITVNGQRVYAEEEQVSLVNHDAGTRTRSVAVGEWMTPFAFAKIRRQVEDEYVLPVISRTARICTSGPVSAPLTLELATSDGVPGSRDRLHLFKWNYR